MSLLLVSLPGNEALAERLAALTGGTYQQMAVNTCPDGEHLPRFAEPVAGHDVVLVCTLPQPDAKILPLLFAADAARAMDARRVGLVAPYLCYMRQDKAFHPGEAVTSRSFAALLSHRFDWLATVDPHLHRTRSLDEIYTIPAQALHAGPVLAAWIKDNVTAPFLIGPDAESRQWVADVAASCGAPFAVLEKQRLGDRHVVTAPGMLALPPEATPVMLDDILSSGGTMVEALHVVSGLTTKTAVVVAIHAVLEDGIRAVQAQGAKLITTNSIGAGAIELAPLLAAAISSMAR